MLKVSNLRKSFVTPDGPVHVIDGVDFTVDEGNCYVLLGPSGCGKTTTLRCVAGLEQADSGCIEIGGQVVSDPERGIYVPVHERPIGMVFQSYAIWPHLDVFENVAYPLRVQRPRIPAKEIEARVMEVIGMVGMEAQARRPASRLSGGQQQRVALARALVRRPKLLLLDEPLSNLDARLRDVMRHELSEMIARVGVTALFVTHDQAEAFAMADQVAVMNRGHIIQEGPPRQIYAQPKASFIATFLGAANQLAGVVDAVLDDGSRRIALQAPGGSQHLVLASDLEHGEEVEVIARPEQISLLLQAPPGHDALALTGTVRKISFLGSVMEYDVDVSGLSVRVISAEAGDVAVGQSVWLQPDHARCSVFARSIA